MNARLRFCMEHSRLSVARESLDSGTRDLQDDGTQRGAKMGLGAGGSGWAATSTEALGLPMVMVS